ncbi:Retrotransposable element Tf2 protein [Rhizoctonia solani]|uniref:Retrotransposable element Tf2 protein n=1 Tax=Rhizoctonia solani TaxID=456999 RepID=A0A8H8P6G3_9AGAM|nr:Retrotransposable element Tf2 protein [Rhizoctonia solani]QRW24437.1 Retrotransposable element Tf2 protein [Rhizoctonia solani]
MERLLKEFHDSPLAGHPGQQRTLELLNRNYWWPGMKSSAKEWVECCPICQANRRAHAPVISLKPLEVPPFPFHTISYDFITGFPKSSGYNAILVVIDSFSKFGHFIPTTKKVTAKGLADLFITHVWKLHGLPVKTVSDRRTTFTGKFLRALYQRLGVNPAFSSAYHLELDGQTERVNQFIEFYLRSYVAADHSDWATWLPLAEYAYNNARHSATGKTPFELVYGRSPVMSPSNVPANVPEADHVADTLAQEWKEAESALRLTKERMAGNKGIIPEYAIGKKVWLDGKNVELRTNSNKLDPKRLGPFEVLEKISSHAYRLKLPETLKIHDVFYVGLLSKVYESPSQPFPERPPPETIEGEEEYEVEQIIDSKRQKGKWFYLIKWKGYGPEDNSWEPEELLEHSQEEIQRFNRSQLKKACDSAKSL